MLDKEYTIERCKLILSWKENDRFMGTLTYFQRTRLSECYAYAARILDGNHTRFFGNYTYEEEQQELLNEIRDCWIKFVQHG